MKNLLVVDLGNDFLKNITPKHRQQKQDVCLAAMGLHQTEKLLHIKGDNQQNKETTYGMGNMCKFIHPIRVNLQNREEAQNNSIARKQIKSLSQFKKWKET